MSDQASASRHFKAREAKPNLGSQIADFFWIWASLRMVVWAYPNAAYIATTYNAIGALAGVLFCFVGSALRLYQTLWLRRPLRDEVKAILVCWAWVVAPLMLLGFSTKALGYFSRVATFSWVLIAPALIIVCRSLFRAGAPATRATRRRVAIAGVSLFSERMLNEIQNTPSLGLSVSGVFDDRSIEREGPTGAPLRNDGSFAQLIAAARAGSIDVVYVALPLRAELRVKDLIRRLQDTTTSVYLAFDFASLAGEGHQRMSHVGGMPVVPLLAGTQPSVRHRALNLVRAMRGASPRAHTPRVGAGRTRSVQRGAHANGADALNADLSWSTGAPAVPPRASLPPQA
jgi:putative colanic acid biosysnthesis UDP-glucose lipid carrier transferase